MIAIGDHSDLDVLFPTPVLIVFGVKDKHGRHAGLKMMRWCAAMCVFIGISPRTISFTI
jgi:hypothetical protein